VDHDTEAFMRALMRPPDDSRWIDAVDALLRPPDWHRDALCAEYADRADWWFPKQGEPTEAARLRRRDVRTGGARCRPELDGPALRPLGDERRRDEQLVFEGPVIVVLRWRSRCVVEPLPIPVGRLSKTSRRGIEVLVEEVMVGARRLRRWLVPHVEEFCWERAIIISLATCRRSIGSPRSPMGCWPGPGVFSHRPGHFDHAQVNLLRPAR
jgi:hypothetical protein